MPTAVVIDGAFFLRRLHHSFPNLDPRDPGDVIFAVTLIAAFHIDRRLAASPAWQAAGQSDRYAPHETSELYRVFFYDCAPLTKRLHTPVGKRAINLANTPEARLRLSIHDGLQRTRKVALRLGKLNEKSSPWRLRPDAVDRWKASGFVASDEDYELDVIQKGVDMRLGLDIAALAYKKLVDQIILVAGDADFVPPAKLARREGIDIVLDPMFAKVADDLIQHVDGVVQCHSHVKSRAPKP